MKRWTGAFIGSVLVVLVAGALARELVRAQSSPPAEVADARVEWELTRMVEVIQEARDYVQRRKDQLGRLPNDVQLLVSEGQQRLQELKQAIQQRDVRSARRAFRAALGVFEEIRLRLKDARDAQDGTTTPEQIAAKLDRAITQLRMHFDELKALAVQNPLPAVDAELARIDKLIAALEARPATATPAALRQQVQDARRALQAIEVTILDQATVSP
jgi:hypothetical protein